MNLPDRSSRRWGGRFRGGLLGAAAMITGITLLSRVLGLGRWLVQAWALGPTLIGDMYNRANFLPNILFEAAAGGALAGALIPTLAVPIARRLVAQTRGIVAGALGWTLLVLVPLGGLLAACSGPMALALGFVGDGYEVGRYLILVFAVQVPVYGVTVLAYAVLQAHERFFWPAFSPILSSVAMIGVYVWFVALADGERSDPASLSSAAITVLAWGTTLAVVLMAMPAVIQVIYLRLLSWPTLRFAPDVGQQFRRLAGAGVVGVAAQQLAVLTAVLVTAGAAGAFTVLQYAQQIYLLPYAIGVVPLVTSVFPRLSQLSTGDDQAGFSRLIASSHRAVSLAAGFGAGAVAATAPAIGALFAALAPSESHLLSEVLPTTLLVLLVGLPGFALMFHGARTLYAAGRARAAVLVNVTGWGAAAAGSLTAVWGGSPQNVALLLAAATAAGMTVGGITALVMVRRNTGAGSLDGVVRTLIVAVGAGAAGAFLGGVVSRSLLHLVGVNLGTMVGAAAGGALVALVVMIALVWLADRSSGAVLRSLARDKR